MKKIVNLINKNKRLNKIFFIKYFLFLLIPLKSYFLLSNLHEIISKQIPLKFN